MARLKTGTRIEIHGTNAQGRDMWERATIARTQAYMLPLPSDDWFPVRFEGGTGVLLVHATRFRVVDTRKGFRP